jgi:hypothetical protein
VTKDEALDLALEALELSAVTVDSFGVQRKTQAAITAIKQARSAPVQEPVADAMASYLRVCSSGGMPKKLQESVQNLVCDAERLGYFKATTPPAAQRRIEELEAQLMQMQGRELKLQMSLNSPTAQRQWVELTNDEVNNFAAGCHLGNSVQDAIFRAAAKLKELNT